MSNEALSPAECIRRFDAKQGGNGIHVDGWVLFPNGAMRENAAWGPLADPPKDPCERARRVVRYHEERLRRARVRFNEYKQGLLAQARGNLQQGQTPPPPTAQAEAVAKLEELQAEVGVCDRACVEARKQLKAAKPAWMVQREEAAAANRSANEEFVNAIGGYRQVPRPKPETQIAAEQNTPGAARLSHVRRETLRAHVLPRHGKMECRYREEGNDRRHRSALR